MTEDATVVLEAISKPRFDAFVGYARKPEMELVALEIAWFESPSSDVFALLIIDGDEQFSGIIFTADLDGRFRWSTQTQFFDTIPEAADALAQLAGSVLEDVDSFREQGDETGSPTDFFHPRVPVERQHQRFRHVAEGKGHRAARAIIAVLMRWYEDRDGNFIEQFQSAGFDARIWELYLWATLVSLGYEVTMPNPSPDFIARGLDGTFAIEATTVNPPTGPDGKPVETPRPEQPEELQAYAEHYLATRYSGPLVTKLGKRYWEKPDVAGLPLVFAIQDFHDELSMTYSIGGLISYLYGVSIYDIDETTGRSKPITEHVWGTKTVPSGFFTLPDSEHVAAVAFNSQGTIAKFNRMGIKCGFDPEGVRLIHEGKRLNASGDEPELVRFSETVEVDYPEDWVDGMNIFHNPNALHPLSPDLIPGATHHNMSPDGDMLAIHPTEHVVSSKTYIVVPVPNEEFHAASTGDDTVY